jgi:hypothetical protein
MELLNTIPPSADAVVGEDLGGYRWVEVRGAIHFEVRPPDAIDIATARRNAQIIQARINAGLDAHEDWGQPILGSDDDETEDALLDTDLSDLVHAKRSELFGFILTVCLAHLVTRDWNVRFTGMTERAPLDLRHIRRLFLIPRMIDGFTTQIEAMGASIEVHEGNV